MCGTLIFLDSLKRGIQMVFFLHHLVISIYFLAATEFSRQCAVILIEFHTASEVLEVTDFHRFDTASPVVAWPLRPKMDSCEAHRVETS